MAEGRFDTARPGGNRAAKTPKGQHCAGINMQFCILSALCYRGLIINKKPACFMLPYGCSSRSRRKVNRRRMPDIGGRRDAAADVPSLV